MLYQSLLLLSERGSVLQWSKASDIFYFNCVLQDRFHMFHSTDLDFLYLKVWYSVKKKHQIGSKALLFAWLGLLGLRPTGKEPYQQWPLNVSFFFVQEGSRAKSMQSLGPAFYPVYHIQDITYQDITSRISHIRDYKRLARMLCGTYTGKMFPFEGGG